MFTTIPFALMVSKLVPGRRVQLLDGRKGLVVQSLPDVFMVSVLLDETFTALTKTVGNNSAVRMCGDVFHSHNVPALDGVDLTIVHTREIGAIRQHEHGWVTVEGEKVTAE
jgi:hypothetical protein